MTLLRNQLDEYCFNRIIGEGADVVDDSRVACHHKTIVKCSLLVIESNLMVIDDSKKSRICHLLDTDISTLNLFAAGIERENGNKTDSNYR